MGNQLSWLEHQHGMLGVRGSTPLFSTKNLRLTNIVSLFMNFFVYIIYSSSLDKYYVGYTFDLKKRLLEHNDGISDFTSKASDWLLKYSEPYSSRELAIKREKEIKKKKSRKYVEWLINSSSIIEQLAFACPDIHREKGHRFDSGNLHKKS